MKADATGQLGRSDERHIPSTRPRPRGAAAAAAPLPVSLVVSAGPEAMWLAVPLVPKHPTARAVHHTRILQLQRTVGNRQVERLLWPRPGQEVKRCDATACDCPAEKQAAHAGLRRLASPHSGAGLPVQRDWWEEDAEGEVRPEESGPSVPDWVGEQAGGAMDSASKQVADAADWMGEQAGGAMEWASQKPSEAAAWVGAQGGAAVDWAVEQVGAGVDRIEEQGSAIDQVWADNSREPSTDPADEEHEPVDEFRLRVMAARPRDALGAWGRLDQRERFAVTLYVGQIYGADFAQGFLHAVANPDFGIDIDTPANVSAQRLQDQGYRFMRDSGDYTIWVLPTGREYWIQNQMSPEDDPTVKEARKHCQDLTASQRNLEQLLKMVEESLGTDDYPQLYHSLADEVGAFAANLNDKLLRFVDLRQQVSPRAHKALEAEYGCVLTIERWKNSVFFPRYGELPVVPPP